MEPTINLPGIGEVEIKEIQKFFKEAKKRIATYDEFRSNVDSFRNNFISNRLHRATCLEDAGNFEHMSTLVKDEYEMAMSIMWLLHRFIGHHSLNSTKTE